MSETVPPKPYLSLGSRLKQFRVKHQKTLAEVSGAVEIDIDTLTQIEQGKTRPAEDILLLLISLFDVKEAEADQLWKLAGYELPKTESQTPEPSLQKQLMVLMPFDNRILFTDDVQISGNQDALTMSFMQNDLSTNKPVTVARVGMSLEQAKKTFELLRRAIYYHAQPKALPAPKKDKRP